MNFIQNGALFFNTTPRQAEHDHSIYSSNIYVISILQVMLQYFINLDIYQTHARYSR